MHSEHINWPVWLLNKLSERSRCVVAPAENGKENKIKNKNKKSKEEMLPLKENAEAVSQIDVAKTFEALSYFSLEQTNMSYKVEQRINATDTVNRWNDRKKKLNSMMN